MVADSLMKEKNSDEDLMDIVERNVFHGVRLEMKKVVHKNGETKMTLRESLGGAGK